MQHNDEAPRAAEPGPATEPHVEARGVQLNRRRLVQGAAVGVVPAILTLRSGGVAALSACPGQVAGTATLEKDTLRRCSSKPRRRCGRRVLFQSNSMRCRRLCQRCDAAFEYGIREAVRWRVQVHGRHINRVLQYKRYQSEHRDPHGIFNGFLDLTPRLDPR